MLTLLAALAKYHIGFNVFRYITFRAAMALLTALLISVVLGPWVIGKLREWQIGETIRVDGPARHKVKAGTPTMGGVLILGALFASSLLWGNLQNRYVWTVLVVTALLAGIGFLDDWRKLRKARPLKIREKFVGQTAVRVLKLVQATAASETAVAATPSATSASTLARRRRGDRVWAFCTTALRRSDGAVTSTSLRRR